jgi:hypothetical protein
MAGQLIQAKHQGDPTLATSQGLIAKTLPKMADGETK